MQVIRNTGYLKKQRRLTRIFTVLGLVLVVVSFVLGFVYRNANFILLTYSLLFAGFMMFNRGMRGMGRWTNSARHQREDVAIDSALEGMSDRVTAIHFGETKAGVVDHAIVHPGGVLVALAKDYPGDVTVKGSTWRKGGSIMSRAFGFGGPQVGNPSGDLKKQLATVDGLLRELDMEVPVEGIVLFTSPTVQIDSDDPDYNVLKLDQLADYLRLSDDGSLARTQDRSAVVDQLSNGAELEKPEPPATRRPVKVRKRAT